MKNDNAIAQDDLKDIISIAGVLREAIERGKGDPPTVAALLHSALVMWSLGMLGMSQEQLVSKTSEAPCPFTNAECREFCCDVIAAMVATMKDD